MSQTVSKLIDALNARYEAKWSFYGTPDQVDDNMAFKIEGIEATFSVSTHGGVLLDGTLDVQIEPSDPNERGEYIFTGDYQVESLLELVEAYRSPIDDWPINHS